MDVWCEDEAGPYQTIPIPGQSWQPTGQPGRQAHEYIRNGTAKLLTLFHPCDGQVRVKGVTSCTNAILLPWLKEQLTAILADLPLPADQTATTAHRPTWEEWQVGLTVKFTVCTELPPLRMILVLDNLVGHTNSEWVCWCMNHGIMLLYTPVAGSWLNMAESIQRVVKRRALDGTHLGTPEEIIASLEAVAAVWNQNPTPFIWGGKRATRRYRAKQRHHTQGGSGAYTHRPVQRPQRSLMAEWRRTCQMTH